MTCWVRSASRAAFSVGSAMASSKELVCSDWVPPTTAARASSVAARTSSDPALLKLEVLADPRTLLPDPVATLESTRVLVKEGFQVLCYTSDDPIMARRLKEAGAASVIPAGSPIGSGQGVLNPNNIRIILEDLKGDDPSYPVIVDAGVGTASDVAIAMELGCDGVLLNTGIASAQDPLRMAYAMRYACEAGRLAYLAGRIPKKLYAQASSPMEGRIAPMSGASNRASGPEDKK